MEVVIFFPSNFSEPVESTHEPFGCSRFAIFFSQFPLHNSHWLGPLLISSPLWRRSHCPPSLQSAHITRCSLTLLTSTTKTVAVLCRIYPRTPGSRLERHRDYGHALCTPVYSSSSPLFCPIQGLKTFLWWSLCLDRLRSLHC
jgi:hypothetical protein